MAQTNSSGNETSLKQLFQSMIPGGPELMEGKVIQINPLKIQMTNDEKLIINERITIVPWHLTDYKTRATYRKMDGTLDSWTKNDGSHADPIGGTHVHHGEDFNLYKGIITTPCAWATSCTFSPSTTGSSTMCLTAWPGRR